MLVKRIALLTILSSTVYELARYWSEIAPFSYPLAFNAKYKGVGNCNFSYSLAFNAPIGGDPDPLGRSS